METTNVNVTGTAVNTDIYAASTQKCPVKEKEEGQVKNGSVYAGNINSLTNDRIEQKREMARKQATDILLGQFATDEEMTDRMDELRTRNREIKDEISDLQKEKKFFQSEQEALKETYGITDDSEEQKELELLYKAKDAMISGDFSSLSKEELEQIANIGELTEYQERALGYYDIMKGYDVKISKFNREIMGNNSDVRMTKMALLKTSYKGISAAKDAAGTILDSASDEIRGMLWEEVKQHVEEELEELKEAAKEKAEEKEALEEKLEAGEQEKNEQEEISEKIQESTSEQEKLQSELDKILKEAELLEEDMKGLVVDGIL